MQRNIYEYHDGARNVFGDPLAINRKFTLLCGGDPNKVLEDTRHEVDEIAIPAIEKLLVAVRGAFELPAFDRLTGNGATDEESFKVLNDFLDWMSKKNQSGESSATSPAPTDAPETPSRPSSETVTLTSAS